MDYIRGSLKEFIHIMMTKGTEMFLFKRTLIILSNIVLMGYHGTGRKPSGTDVRGDDTFSKRNEKSQLVQKKIR